MNPPSTTESPQVIPAKSQFYPTFFLGLFLGVFGVHRFYTGKIKSGVVQLLTFGGLGIWWFIDMVMILLGKFKDKNGVTMANASPKMTWGIFIVAVIIGIASQAGTTTADSTAGSLGETTSASSEQDEVFLCQSPASILRLSQDATANLMVNGEGCDGHWSKSGNTIEFKMETGGAPSRFAIQSDGSLVETKYGYRYEKLPTENNGDEKSESKTSDVVGHWSNDSDMTDFTLDSSGTCSYSFAGHDPSNGSWRLRGSTVFINLGDGGDSVSFVYRHGQLVAPNGHYLTR